MLKLRMSMKSLRFWVHRSAPSTIAHAAIARSTSRDRGVATRRYKSAASSASRAPKGRASSVGNRFSCVASSMSVRGPLRHSNNTSDGIFIRSPRSIAARNSGSARLGPVSASIKTEVSSRIIRPSLVVHRSGGALGSPEALDPLRQRTETQEWTRACPTRQACESALPRSDDQRERDSRGLRPEPLGSLAWKGVLPRHSACLPSPARA